MESDIKLLDGTVELTGENVRVDVGFAGGTVELSGSNFKTSVSNMEMQYYGGHLMAKGGNMELGCGDSGTFKGFSQLKDGTIKIAGDVLKAAAGSFEIGNRSGGAFKGLELLDSGVRCHAHALEVLNPSVQKDSQQRVALAQSSGDELQINVNGHYKGGVKLEGPINMTGDVSVPATLQIKVGGKLLLLTPDRIANLRGGKKRVTPGVPIDVLAVINSLAATVKQLQSKVAALEASKEVPHD